MGRLKLSARLVVVLIALGTVGCDQASKHVARAHLAGRPAQVFLGDTFRLQYAENPGAFLSLGATWPGWMRLGVFTLATSAALLWMAAASLRAGSSAMLRLGLGMIWAGGASNLIDRIANGRVVDFLNLGLGPWRTGSSTWRTWPSRPVRSW